MAHLPVLARLAVGLTAGLIGFALAGALLLSLGSPEGWSYLAMFVAAPAAVTALLPLRVRIFCFALAVLAVAGTALMNVSGPDNPMVVFPLLAIGWAAAAVVAEICVRACMRILKGTLLNGR